MTIFDLLDQVRLRPAMYVGESNADRGAQLRNLEHLLNGYAFAVQAHGIAEPAGDFQRGFGEFLRSRFGWSMAAGPIAAIRAAARDDDAAWATLWTLVDDFKESLGG